MIPLFKVLPVVALAALILPACGPSASGTPAADTSGPIVETTAPDTGVLGSPVPQPTQPAATPIPALPNGASPTELKYRLLEQYPDFFYCDPDLYPVARLEDRAALERFAEIQANTEVFDAILAHNGLTSQADFSDEQKLLIYQQYKKLAAIQLELSGDVYTFQLQTGVEGQRGFVVTGSIDAQGQVTETGKTPTVLACPVCLAVHTMIDTPSGPVAVENLRAGDLVWTLDTSGERVAAPIVQVGHVAVPSTHKVVHLVLDDGRELWASPGHPSADGRLLGDLRVGDTLDGSLVLHADLVPYSGGATYDILPAGDTGFYWAAGILMGSTLR